MRNLNQLLVLTNYGTSNDQSMLGIGEVWYFSSKTAVFDEIMVPSCRVMIVIVCCGGTYMGHWLLGIGEVWYFLTQQLFFDEMIISLCCVMNSIACCARHETLKSLFVSLSKPISNQLFYFKVC